MPTVDDLVISLRIDETSNLGKLQKQLEALVGPKGEKALELGAGVDPNLKRDIGQIKGYLEFITHIAPGVDMDKLAVSAAALYKQLSDPTMFKNIKDKMGKSEEWLRDIMEILADIAIGETEMKAPKIAKMVGKLKEIITLSPSLVGQIRGAVTDLTEAVEEFIRQRQLNRIFKEFGTSIREVYLGMTKTPEELKDAFAETPELLEFLKQQEEEVGVAKIDELVQKIEDIKDPLKVLAMFEDINILEFTKLPDKLKPLAAAYIKAMQTNQYHLVDLMVEFFRNITKNRKTITQVLDSASIDFLMTLDVWERVVERLEGEGMELLTGKIPDAAKYVKVELEKGTMAKYIREMKNRIETFDNVVVLFLNKTNQNLDKHLDTLNKVGEETKHSFAAYGIEIGKIKDTMGELPTIDEMTEKVKEAHDATWEKLDERLQQIEDEIRAKAEKPKEEIEWEKEKEMEGLEAILKGLDDMDSGIGKDLKTSDDKLDAAAKAQDEEFRKLMELNKKTKENTEEIKEKLDKKPKKEQQESDDVEKDMGTG